MQSLANEGIDQAAVHSLQMQRYCRLSRGYESYSVIRKPLRILIYQGRLAIEQEQCAFASHGTAHGQGAPSGFSGGRLTMNHFPKKEGMKKIKRTSCAFKRETKHDTTIIFLLRLTQFP
jgi:hypothetical protein